MAHMHTQWGVGRNPCYTPTKIGTATGGSGSMKMALVPLSNDVLPAAVFQIVGMTTQGNDNHL